MYELIVELKSQIRGVMKDPKKEIYLFAGENGYWIYHGSAYRYLENLGDVVKYIQKQTGGIELILDKLPSGIEEKNNAGMVLLRNSEIRCLKDCLS